MAMEAKGKTFLTEFMDKCTGWFESRLSLADVAADFGTDVSGSDESTLLQAIRSLENGDEEEAVQLAERGGAAPKPPCSCAARRARRTAAALRQVVRRRSARRSKRF